MGGEEEAERTKPVHRKEGNGQKGLLRQKPRGVQSRGKILVCENAGEKIEREEWWEKGNKKGAGLVIFGLNSGTIKENNTTLMVNLKKAL